MTRGRLRVMLGAAPGVGKTYAMLEEGRRLAAAGKDVVLAVVETHGRAATSALVEGLELIPRQSVEHRGVVLQEMDLEAVLARTPELALVDELAHTNAPGSVHDKRWQDVEAILAAGIDVISTVNIQHIESLNDVVRQITGSYSARRSPTRSCEAPTRSNWSTSRPRPCVTGSARAWSTPPVEWMPPSATTFVWATSPRCASWPCSGSPMRWTRRCGGTGRRRASTAPGMPANASLSPSPAVARARPCCAGGTHRQPFERRRVVRRACHHVGWSRRE